MSYVLKEALPFSLTPPRSACSCSFPPYPHKHEFSCLIDPMKCSVNEFKKNNLPPSPPPPENPTTNRSVPPLTLRSWGPAFQGLAFTVITTNVPVFLVQKHRSYWTSQQNICRGVHLHQPALLKCIFTIYSEITLLSVCVHAHSCCSAIPEE